MRQGTHGMGLDTAAGQFLTMETAARSPTIATGTSTPAALNFFAENPGHAMTSDQMKRHVREHQVHHYSQSCLHSACVHVVSSGWSW